MRAARVLAVAAVMLCALTAASSAFGRDGTITSFDGTKIVHSFFPAGTGKAPTVMMGPGYSMSRAGADDASVKALVADGYNVLTWDPRRGSGDSSGTVEVDSPEYASALIDYLAQQPEVALDAPGNPRLGMFGASYGGGIEWVTAATDKRVDVIAPSISWNSLITSLDKNDTAKGGWGSVLFGVGIEGSTVPGVTGGATGQPNGFQFGRMQDPATQRAFANGVATGSFEEERRAAEGWSGSAAAWPPARARTSSTGSATPIRGRTGRSSCTSRCAGWTATSGATRPSTPGRRSSGSPRTAPRTAPTSTRPRRAHR